MWFSLQKSISLKKKKKARGGRVNITILLHPGKANPVRLSLQEAVRPFHPVISCKHSRLLGAGLCSRRTPKPFS